MADWESKTLKTVISEISNSEFVLPVIQRKLVWNEEQMISLFNSLFKTYSFGAVIVFEEEINEKPIFAFHNFILDYTDEIKYKSEEPKILNRKHFLVIDGQQRLQSFYIGLCGSYEKKELYFDLYSDFQIEEYDFKFFLPEKEIFSDLNADRAGRKYPDSKYKPVEYRLWYNVKKLFNELSSVRNASDFAANIIDGQKIDSDNDKEHIRRNVQNFYDRIFTDKSIGISKVYGKPKYVDENRQWMLELFRRLNTSGTKLSNLDLFASKLKSFNPGIENFFNEMLSDKNKFERFGEDEIIKLLMILQDEPLKDITDMEKKHADFAANPDNTGQILQTVDALKNFLKLTKDYDWFVKKKSSLIPLYLIAYYLFHNPKLRSKLSAKTQKFDETDSNFSTIKKWLRISLINGIFTYGCGWRPIDTGFKLLQEELRKYKGKNFPIDELFHICVRKLHDFREKITDSLIDEFQFGKDYILYLIYDYQILNRYEKDHIVPKKILLEAHIDEKKINSLANIELLNSSDNKNKRDKNFIEWMNEQKQADYIKRHLIPVDYATTLKSKPTADVFKKNFDKFLKSRAKLIADKINDSLK